MVQVAWHSDGGARDPSLRLKCGCGRDDAIETEYIASHCLLPVLPEFCGKPFLV